MCGIATIINFNQHPVHDPDIRSMMHTMKHRGPDDEDVYMDGNVGMGFVRLSILDLSEAGRQPMHSRGGRYVVVFNGEIFNYIEIREELKSLGHVFCTGTDTEVLLAAYGQWGRECLHRFNGMWAFIIYDKRDQKIFASRDRYGIKPFYYYTDDNSLKIASEIPPLLKVIGKKPEPNRNAIFDYLVYNRTDQTEKTFFKDIYKLQHGCIMELDVRDLDSIKISRWYNLRERVEHAEPFQSPDEFRRLLQSAVELRLRSDVPVGICLSGGIDSSAIVSTILHSGENNDINTFSAIYGKGVRGDESTYIDEYKPLLKNMHFTMPRGEELLESIHRFVRAFAEPVPTTRIYAQYRVMQLAKEHVVVTLDGQGADELLAGYHYFFGYYFKDLLRAARLGTLGSEICHYLATHRSLYGLKTFAFFLLPEKMRRSARAEKNGYLHRDFINTTGNDNTIAGSLYGSETLYDALLKHFEYKLEHLLKYEDRNSMVHSLEGRVPFLDYRLVERTLALRGRDVIHRGNTKYILRESMKDLLPEKIRVRRDKIGFATPEDEWFRLPAFQEFIMYILQSPSFKNRQIVDPAVAVQLYQQHLAGKKNISREIWKWIHLELWHREFIDVE